jgi:hypothetical protein
MCSRDYLHSLVIHEPAYVIRGRECIHLKGLGHANYFRLSSYQGAGTSCFVADCDSAFSDKGSLRFPKLAACYALKFRVV